MVEYYVEQHEFVQNTNHAQVHVSNNLGWNHGFHLSRKDHLTPCPMGIQCWVNATIIDIDMIG